MDENQNLSPEEAAAVPLPPAQPPSPMSMKEVLGIAAMRRMWYAQIVSTFGDMLALSAVMIVMTYQLHASAQQITGIQIAYMLPIAVLGILSGVFVDRWPLKITLVSSDFVRFALVLLLLVVKSVWGFYAVLAAISIFSSFFTPAQGVAVRAAVPPHGLRSANALLQQVMFVIRAVGTPIAATLVTAFGAKYCYWVDALSFLASGALLASMSLQLPQRSAVVETVRGKSAVMVTSEAETKTGLAKVLDDMKGGLSFIVHHAGLLFVIVSMAAAMFVMGCFGPLIAVYVRDTLHAATKTFGFTMPVLPIGLMVGINTLNAKAKQVKHATLVYGGLLGIALGTVILAALPFVAATAFGLLVIGFGVSGIIVPSQTMIQEETPHAMMGRVGSTVMSLIFGAQIAGLFVSGVLSEHIGVRAIFAICAAMLVALIVAGKLWMEPKGQATATA